MSDLDGRRLWVLISEDGIRFQIDERSLVKSRRLKREVEQGEGVINVGVRSVDLARVLVYLNRSFGEIQGMIAEIEDSLENLHETACFLDIPEMVQMLKDRILALQPPPPIYRCVNTDDGGALSVDMRAIRLSQFIRREFLDIGEGGSTTNRVISVPILFPIFRLAVEYMNHHSGVKHVPDLDGWDKGFVDKPEATLWALLDCSLELEIKEMAILIAMKLEKSQGWSSTHLYTALGGAALVVGVSTYFGLSYFKEAKEAAVETFQGVNKVIEGWRHPWEGGKDMTW